MIAAVPQLQRAHEELAASEAAFRSRAESSQATLEEVVKSKEEREQVLYIKVISSVRYLIYIKLFHYGTTSCDSCAEATVEDVTLQPDGMPEA